MTNSSEALFDRLRELQRDCGDNKHEANQAPQSS